MNFSREKSILMPREYFERKDVLCCVIFSRERSILMPRDYFERKDVYLCRVDIWKKRKMEQQISIMERVQRDNYPKRNVFRGRSFKHKPLKQIVRYRFQKIK